MSKKQFACPKCSMANFASNAALTAHMKAKHPEAPAVPEPMKLEGEGVHPGYNHINCPTCKQPAVVYLNEDHTIASSSEVPKLPPTSGGHGRTNPIKRGAHPTVIASRYKMRWNEKEGRWKNTVAMMGTHGKTASEMPWY